MTTSGDVTDSPVKWVAEHASKYVESDGAKGHRWSGVKTLLITTRGRKTGLQRRTPLIYGQDGERYVVVGSNGGKKDHPSWYLNLQKDPDVGVQVGPEKFPARARTATGEERERLWQMMSAIWSDYERYQNKVGRELPVVVLERSD
jgi:deazaflavin-dependent oxidoreductase (nitroreductase family)